jgi:hypothetical protein
MNLMTFDVTAVSKCQIVSQCVTIAQSESEFRGVGEGFGQKRGTPPTHSTEAILSRKSTKIAKNLPKSHEIREKAHTEPKSNSNGLFKRFLSVFLTHKFKMGSKTTIVYYFL